MKRTVDLDLADRLINGPLPISELPDVSALDESLRRLEADEAYSIRHRRPPPLWTEVGNDAVRTYYAEHSDHPMSNENRARDRRNAAFIVLAFATTQTSAFTPLLAIM